MIGFGNYQEDGQVGGESSRETLVRELIEETSFAIEPQEIIDVFTRLPGDFFAALLLFSYFDKVFNR